MDDAFLLAHLLVKTRAAAVAEQRGKDVERGDVRVMDVRDVPTVMHVAELDGGLLDDFARGELARLGGDEQRRHGAGFSLGETLADLRDDLVDPHVADDDEEEIVWRVTGAVIADDVLSFQFVEDVEQANDGQAIRTAYIRSFEKSFTRTPVRVVLPHVHLAADDVELLGERLLGQRGVLDDVAQDVDGDARAGVRHVDVIDRSVERRVGVHVTAGFLNLLIDPAAGACRRAFEKHMLEHVRKTGAEPRPFVDAAGLAPHLRGDDRCGVVLAEDEGQAVVERDDADTSGQGRDAVAVVGGRENLVHCEVHHRPKPVGGQLPPTRGATQALSDSVARR